MEHWPRAQASCDQRILHDNLRHTGPRELSVQLAQILRDQALQNTHMSVQFARQLLENTPIRCGRRRVTSFESIAKPGQAVVEPDREGALVFGALVQDLIQFGLEAADVAREAVSGFSQ